MRLFLGGVFSTLAILVAAALIIARTGHVNFQADQEPSALETKFAMSAVDASAERHAPKTTNAIQPTEENLVAGARLYRDYCAGCHGDPANPETAFGHSFYPPVPQFMKDAPDMPEHENFYIIQHGIRWTGMPAWKGTFNDNQIWQLVTFLGHMDKLPPSVQQEFHKTAASNPSGSRGPTEMRMPMPARPSQ
jgi:mono/diheme cytochrome c family protein